MNYLHDSSGTYWLTIKNYLLEINMVRTDLWNWRIYTDDDNAGTPSFFGCSTNLEDAKKEIEEKVNCLEVKNDINKSESYRIA